MTGPLADVRVLDLGSPAVEITTRILAELGADVVLVEPPGGGASRREGRTVRGIALDHAVRNSSKRGVVLDVHDDGDRAALLDLAAASDLVLHGATPDELGALGLHPDTLLERAPHLVVMGVTDFGATGPRAGHRGSADVHAAVGGVLARSGLPGRPPLLPPEHLALESAALQAAWFALLHHWAARRRGHGDVVDFSVLEGVAQTLDPGFGVSGSARGGLSSSPKHRGRPDMRHLYPIARCADGWARYCVLAPRQWRGMWRWLGEPAEFADERFGRMKDRYQARDRIDPLIEKLFASRTRAQIEAEGEEHGVPAAGIYPLEEVLGLEHFAARGSFVADEIAPEVESTVPAGMLADESGRLGRRRRAPELGEHTDAVRAEWTPRITASADPERPDDDRPLAGVRVVDLGVIVAGAEASRVLADHGAEVIKVESAAFPDGSRQSVDGRSMTPSFAWGNRNKSSIGLDLRSAEGKELFLRLVADSDLVLSNFKPGTMASLGFDDDALRGVNDRIVTVASSAFGASGPWARRMGYGPLVRATTGLSGLWRYPDDDESFSDAMTIYPDHVAGRLAALAAVAKLLERQRTGRGGTVEIAQAELILTQMAGLLVAAGLEPGSVEAEGNDRVGDAPRGVVPTGGDDDWMVVDVRGDAAFAGLAAAIGRPEWRDDPRLATAEGRVAAREELRAAVASWAAGLSPGAAVERLQAHGVAAGEMLRVAELRDDPHLQERGFLVVQEQPQLDDPLPAHGVEGRSRHLPEPRLRPAPHQSEQTREIARRVLGLADDEIERLLADGVLEEWAPE